MHNRLLAIPAILFFTACSPLAIPPINDEKTSSATVIGTQTGELNITPEPFIEPFDPISHTGAVTVQERLLSGGVLEIGDAHARVTMEIFLNVESPYARAFQLSRMPIVLEKFIRTGDVKARIHILSIEKYEGSEPSARGINCAAEQGKGYLALMRMVEDEQVMLSKGDDDDLGIDSHLFTVCNTDGRDALSASRAAAARLGVTLVPTYAIDGKVFTGLPTEADLVSSIRAAL